MFMKFLVELGSEVKSNINGFKGIVSARSEHLNGCNRYWIQPKVGKDGKAPDGAWYDEGELIVINSSKLKRKNSDRGGFHSSLK
jgi:hypothetical protein